MGTSKMKHSESSERGKLFFIAVDSTQIGSCRWGCTVPSIPAGNINSNRKCEKKYLSFLFTTLSHSPWESHVNVWNDTQ